MKLHWLQHVPFEGLGHIGDWAKARNVELSCTRLYADETLPPVEHFDGLVVMGGPMGIYDHDKHPWLAAEKQFIKEAIDARKPVLGICLGAQLIADVLDARVYPGTHKEIGWFPINQSSSKSTAWMTETPMVFHWHGDTFDLPDGAVRLASSVACTNQGFLYEDHVAALQFHLETTTKGMEALIDHCGHELVEAPYIQTAEQMRIGQQHIPQANALMDRLLDNLFI